MNQNPTKLKTTFTGVSVVINSPARLPSHPPPYQYPAHRPSKLRKTSSTSSIDPLDPTCPQSTPQQPKQPDVYVPKSLPVPILSRGPCTASPSYGLERIVGRFYDDDSGPWYYKVEKRRRHYTTPEKEEANVALTAAAGDYLTEPERKIHQIIKTEDSSTTSGTSTSQSQSGGEEPYQRGHEYFLVPPQDILDHVSAAELEVFENNYVRRQGLEEETERQAEMERRQRVMERKRQLAAAAKAQGLAIDMKKTSLETQTASVRSQSRSATPADTPADGRSKRKAGTAAAHRLAATPWTKRGFKQDLRDSPATTSSSSPRPRGRPKGTPMANAKTKASSKPMEKETAKTTSRQPEEGTLGRIVSDRATIINPRTREFEVEWAGKPGQNTWMSEDEVPSSLIDDYEREYDVEEIIKDWKLDGVRMFEVSWEGFPGENTFQTEESLPPEMVEEYFQRKAGIVRMAGGDGLGEQHADGDGNGDDDDDEMGEA